MSAKRFTLAALTALTLFLLPALQPLASTYTWTAVDVGVAMRPNSNEVPHDEPRRVTARATSANLLLLGTEMWHSLPPPADLDSFAAALRQQLTLPIRSRVAATLAVRRAGGGAAHNHSRGCLGGCNGRGRCDQLLGQCVCRHGYRGDYCEQLVPQLCNDPRDKCVGRDCHEWTRFVSRCSGECDLSSNRCTCGARAAYPDRHMFMCEWRGIEQLTKWRSPGWAHFTVVEPHQFWSMPNTTPNWFERAVPERRLKELFHLGHQAANRKLERRQKMHALDGSALAWCDRPPTPSALRTATTERYPRCACYEDRGGRMCEIVVRSFCLNQCSDRGECVRGFCMCTAGWSGSDCSIPMVPIPEDEEHARAWASSWARATRPAATAAPVAPVASANASAWASSWASSWASANASTTVGAGLSTERLELRGDQRRSREIAAPSAGLSTERLELRGGHRASLRPAIYVYELPVWYNGWLLETRLHPHDCTYRRYKEENTTNWENYAFGLELALHEVLLASPHRTLNPEAADFFYVPVYGGCYISRFFRPTPLHTLIINESPLDWRAAPIRGNIYYRQALHWLRTEYPYWNRTGGRDHLFAFPHDEGACVAPIELQNATLLSSWGRVEKRYVDCH